MFSASPVRSTRQEEDTSNVVSVKGASHSKGCVVSWESSWDLLTNAPRSRLLKSYNSPTTRSPTSTRRSGSASIISVSWRENDYPEALRLMKPISAAGEKERRVEEQRERVSFWDF